MKKQRIYDLVKELLTDYPELRDSDRKLRSAIYRKLGFIFKYYESQGEEMISLEDLEKNTPDPESIRRSRQKIMELHPELRGSKWVQRARAEKAEDKGVFIYREEIREQGSLI